MTKVALVITSLLTIWHAPDGPVLVRHARRSGGSEYVQALATAAEDASRAYRLDPLLLVTLAHQESGLDWQAVQSRTRARGLLQLMPRSTWGIAAARACRAGKDACVRAQMFEGARALRYALDACRASEIHAITFHRFGQCGRVIRWRERRVIVLRNRMRKAVGA